MKKLKDSILEKLKVNDENAASNNKIDKTLELVKHNFDKTFSNTNIKYTKGLDVNGNKIQIGDLVMYSYSSGGYDELFMFKVGVVIDFENNSYGNKVILNIDGDEEKPITSKVYCGSVMIIKPEFIEKLYK